ncbi:Peptide methionine sulfoxide reductase MsrA, partial [Oxalobacteraceae bacterium IMCC9480]
MGNGIGLPESCDIMPKKRVDCGLPWFALKSVLKTEGANMATEMATLGGGCFWCTEAVYQQLNGVLAVESGYTGGSVVNPSYEAVCNGTTGHAEVVRISFDNSVVSYRELLEVFFTIHDPTTL